MKTKHTKATLAHNLKFYRSERGFSQKDIAASANLSYRLIQDIESEKGNPTLDSLSSIAVALRISVETLIRLSQIRLHDNGTSFIERYIQIYKDEKIGIGLRTLDGTAIWANRSAQKIHGGLPMDDAPFNLMDTYSIEARGVLKNQMSSEKNGFCNGYTIAHVNPATKEPLFLKFHPTLIFPSKGTLALYTAVYITEIRDDCALNYFNYCSRLLSLVHDN